MPRIRGGPRRRDTTSRNAGGHRSRGDSGSRGARALGRAAARELQDQDPSARHTAADGGVGRRRDRAAPPAREDQQHRDRCPRPDRHRARGAREPAQPAGLAQRSSRIDASPCHGRPGSRGQRRGHGRLGRVPPRRRPRHSQHGLHHVVDRSWRWAHHRRPPSPRGPRHGRRDRAHDHRP